MPKFKDKETGKTPLTASIRTDRLSALPDELLLEIIKHVEVKIDLSSLCSCSYRMANITRPALFHAISLQGKSLGNLVPFLEAAPFVANFTRKLDLRGFLEIAQRSYVGGACEQEICKILQRLGKLEQLTTADLGPWRDRFERCMYFNSENAPEVHPHRYFVRTMAKLPWLAIVHLEGSSVRPYEINYEPSRRVWWTMCALLHLPELKDLTITSFQLPRFGSYIKDRETGQICHSLHSLSLRHCYLPSKLLGAILRAAPNLKEFIYVISKNCYKNNDFGARKLGQALDRYAPNVQRLTIQTRCPLRFEWAIKQVTFDVGTFDETIGTLKGLKHLNQLTLPVRLLAKSRSHAMLLDTILPKSVESLILLDCSSANTPHLKADIARMLAFQDTSHPFLETTKISFSYAKVWKRIDPTDDISPLRPSAYAEAEQATATGIHAIAHAGLTRQVHSSFEAFIAACALAGVVLEVEARPTIAYFVDTVVPSLRYQNLE